MATHEFPAQYALVPFNGGAAFTLELGADMLTLHGDDDRTVLMLPREEAARYLQFDRDLRRGKVIAFRLLGGLRSMRFLCPAPTAHAVTAWLPRGPRRLISAPTLLLVVCGIAGLAWPPTRPEGAVIALLAALNLAPIPFNLALLNAIVCGACAIAALFGPALGFIAGAPAAAFLYGALLALAAIEHLGYAGPNRAVLEARLAAAHAATGRHSSRLVRGVAYATGAASLAFFGLAAALLLMTGAPWAILRDGDDALVFVVAAVVLALPIPLLLMRSRPPYSQALHMAQFLIAVLTVYTWGLASGLFSAAPVDYTSGVFAAAIAASTRPYFAAPLVVLEIAFRAWFTRAAEREAAEAD